MCVSITVCIHQVTDKPAEAIDERRLAPWERRASLAEGSLHEGLRLSASMRIDQTRRPGAAAEPASKGPPSAPCALAFMHTAALGLELAPERVRVSPEAELRPRGPRSAALEPRRP